MPLIEPRSQGEPEDPTPGGPGDSGFRYRVEFVPQQTDNEDIQEVLNHLATQGWRLVSFVPAALEGSPDHRGYYIVLEAPLQEDHPPIPE